MSTNRTPFYQTKSKVFAKHQNVLLKSTKFFFYRILELLQKSMVRVEKQNNFSRNSTFRAQDLGFGARFWIQGFGFLVLCLGFWVWCLGFFGVFVVAVTCDCCCFGRNNITMREICTHSDICNSENHVIIQVKQEWISGAPVAIYIYIYVFLNPKPENNQNYPYYFHNKCKRMSCQVRKTYPCPITRCDTKKKGNPSPAR